VERHTPIWSTYILHVFSLDLTYITGHDNSFIGDVNSVGGQLKKYFFFTSLNV